MISASSFRRSNKFCVPLLKQRHRRVPRLSVDFSTFSKHPLVLLSVARTSSSVQPKRSPPRTLTMAAFPKPSADPPKHEMVHFPQMTTSLPSESSEFRRVLWTGLYSQLVLMTVPVGGDIGDEVYHHVPPCPTFPSFLCLLSALSGQWVIGHYFSLICHAFFFHQSLRASSRYIPSTKSLPSRPA